jgi:hypothetical protein
MADAEPIAAADGLTVAQAMAELGLGRTAFYQRLRQLAIVPATHKGRAYLSAEQLEQLRTFGQAAALARQPAAGLLAMAAQVSAADRAHSADSEQEGGERERLELLALRLRVLRDALELGAPLTTAAVSDLLGARPGGPEVVRGRIVAVREGRDCWSLERLPMEPPGA